MEKQLNYGRQTIEQDDIDAVVETLKGDWLTQGPTVDLFEKELASYCGAKHAIAVCNGTAALFIANRAINCSAQRGITTPLTFVATPNGFEYSKIETQFVDIDRGTLNIDLEKATEAIDIRTRVISPVHFAGLPCDMDYIAWMRKKYNIIVIEDACHALGASFGNDKTGCCKHSEFTIFSFHPVKHITTGEGGALLTNDDELAKRARRIRNHGISKDDMTYGRSSDPWYYEMQELGVNARITDIQCALGLSQLNKLDRFVARRKEIAERYKKEIISNNFGIRTQYVPKGVDHSYHLFVVMFDCAIFDRRTILNKLKDKGINCQIHYIPCHLQPYYRNKYNYGNGFFPNAEDYYKSCLSLPIYPLMTDEDVDYVIKTFNEVTKEFKNKPNKVH